MGRFASPMKATAHFIVHLENEMTEKQLHVQFNYFTKVSCEGMDSA